MTGVASDRHDVRYGLAGRLAAVGVTRDRIGPAPLALNLSSAQRTFSVALLMIVCLLTTADRSMMLVLLEPIKNDMLLTDTQAGFLAGPAFGIAYGLCCLPLSLFADRYSYKRVLGFCVMFWSVMTALCGLAYNMVTLAIARMGVGVGESAAIPCSMAIASSMFSARTRTSVISLLYGGAATGTALAFIGGSYIAGDGENWRAAFFVFAAPGILVALLLLLFVREPLRSTERIKPSTFTQLKETATFIVRRRSLSRLIIAKGLSHFFVIGTISFMTSFLIRSHGFSLKEASVMLAIGFGGFASLSTGASGLIVDHFSRGNDLWRMRICALTSVCSVVALLGLVSASNTYVLFACFGAYMLMFPVFIGPAMGLTLNLVPSESRATTAAFCTLLQSSIAGGLSPVVFGLISDALQPQFGEESLRYTIMITAPMALITAVLFLSVNKTLLQDLERASQPT